MKPLVSIIVPSHQQAGFLRATLDSILSQQYHPIEVLVMDGGSTDGSVQILQSYGDRIWFRSEPDKGQCSAINEGFRRSRGDILAWLNSDDFYYPGAVNKAVDALLNNPEAGLVYGEGNQVDETGNVKWRFPETIPFNLWRLANVTDYILQPTVFFRREALFASGLLDESLNWGLDWDLCIRMGTRYPFAYIDEVLAASRLHRETKTSMGGFRRMMELYRILHHHGVKGVSPAVVVHAVATLVRALIPSAEIMNTDVVTKSLHGIVGSFSRTISARAERMFRRWLQNVQGIWPCGFVGRHGKIWLPSYGRPCRLELSGRNLEIFRQQVTLRSSGRSVKTVQLSPREAFRLELDIPEGSIPVKAELICNKVREVGPLDQRLGPRRAGFTIESLRMVSL